MKFAIALLFAALSMSAANIKVTFDHDTGSAQRCSATITTNCLDHYEAGVMEGSNFSSLVNIPIPAGTGKLTNITGQFMTEKVGSVTVVVFAVAKGANGNRTASAPATVILTIDYVPNIPTNLRGELTIALTFKVDGTVTAKLEPPK